jgi:SNF2 family DNA or RNA helicase
MDAVFKRGGEHASCPFCRNALRPDLVNNVNLESIKKGETPDAPVDMQTYKIDSPDELDAKKALDSQINKYGTKLAHLMKYLNEIFVDPKARVIIFSQYDKMLTLIGSVLAQFAIQHVFVKGNVFVVNKNIKRFKEDPKIRVIMLSSETAASGSNLTEASHIVFVNVMNATKDETLALEVQCIGRSIRLGQNKNVVLKRFIMENTVEQEYYEHNKYDIRTLQA